MGPLKSSLSPPALEIKATALLPVRPEGWGIQADASMSPSSVAKRAASKDRGRRIKGRDNCISTWVHAALLAKAVAIILAAVEVARKLKDPVCAC